MEDVNWRSESSKTDKIKDTMGGHPVATAFGGVLAGAALSTAVFFATGSGSGQVEAPEPPEGVEQILASGGARSVVTDLNDEGTVHLSGKFGDITADSIWLADRSAGKSQAKVGDSSGEVVLDSNGVYVDNHGGILGALGVKDAPSDWVKLDWSYPLAKVFPDMGIISDYFVGDGSLEDSTVTVGDSSLVLDGGKIASMTTPEFTTDDVSSSSDKVDPSHGNPVGTVDADGKYTKTDKK